MTLYYRPSTCYSGFGAAVVMVMVQQPIVFMRSVAAEGAPRLRASVAINFGHELFDPINPANPLESVLQCSSKLLKRLFSTPRQTCTTK